MRVDVMSVPFDNVTLNEAVDIAVTLLAGDTPSYVVTPNPEIVHLCRHNAAAASAVTGAALILPDGIGVVQAASKLGRPLKGRVPGIDFARALMGEMAKRQKRLFLLGAKPGVAQAAADNLRREIPGLQIVGVRDGYFSDTDEVLREIRNTSCDVVFVCLGAPRQELWMQAHGRDTGARLHVGLGGSLDVWSGTVKRAPKLFIRLNLEWLYRLVRYPSRFFRIGKLISFRLAVGREARREKRARRRSQVGA